jgi:hypothetical protein
MMQLTERSYAFAQHDDAVGFTISIDESQRAVVIPGSAPAAVDTIPVTEPTFLGSGVLDVRTARFLVRPGRPLKRATDWLDQDRSIDRAEPVVDVPHELAAVAYQEEAARSSRRLFRRRRAKRARSSSGALDIASWELIEKVRAIRTDSADRERYLHPDPAELAVRAANRAPILGLRQRSHPLFATVGVICADMPWMPRFDDIRAIPESLGVQLQPLMSLPSIPIPADLRIGPLGIAGTRSAAMACARHIVTSLYAMSGASDLRLHIVTGDDRLEAWGWCLDIAPHREIEPSREGFPVVIVDGMEHFAKAGISHQDAIENRVGMVVLADEVEGLPPYSGTVLQVDRGGEGRLTNHKGHVITGTPIGITADFARRLADDLFATIST